MKSKLLLCALLLCSPVFAASEPTAPKTAEAAKRHPLRGVIVSVNAEKSALMIKHEEIPGVMRAMTMQFKVDAATIKSAKAGQAITGQMSREADGWWLHDAKLTPPATK